MANGKKEMEKENGQWKKRETDSGKKGNGQ